MANTAPTNIVAPATDGGGSNTLKKVLIIGAFVLFFGGVAYAGVSIKKQYDLLLNGVKVGFSGIKPVTVTATNVTLTVSLVITNASTLTVTITSLNADVSINTKHISTVTQNVNQLLKPNASSIIAFNVTFNPSNFSGTFTVTDILNALNVKNDVIGIHGSANATVDGISIENIPVDFDVNLGSALAA